VFVIILLNFVVAQKSGAGGAAKRPPCSPRPECASCGRSADPTPRVEKSHARLNLLGSIVPTSCSSGSLRPGGANPVAVGRRLVLLRLPPHLPTHLLPFPSPTRLLPFPSTAATILIASPALGGKKKVSPSGWWPSHPRRPGSRATCLPLRLWASRGLRDVRRSSLSRPLPLSKRARATTGDWRRLASSSTGGAPPADKHILFPV